MTQPRRDKSTLPDPSYHWTTYKASAFIGALAHFGRESEAARAVGMARQSAYRLRERLGKGGVLRLGQHDECEHWDDWRQILPVAA